VEVVAVQEVAAAASCDKRGFPGRICGSVANTACEHIA
jgi:hypothetical protein